MKELFIVLLAAGLLTSVASAQLVYNIEGDTGVRAQFTFTIDDVANEVTVFIDNTVAGVGGAQGRITSFGFFAPFSDTELGTDGDAVSFTEDADGDWSLFEPYELSGESGIFFQTIGAGTGSGEEGGGSDPGIAWGSTATFVFTFPDFDNTAVWGGEDSLSARFQSIVDTQSDETSDKVLGTPDDGGGGGSGAVPEPSTYGLIAALALLGLAVVRQLRLR